MLTVDFDRLGIKPGHLVLDAGCGGGRHSLEFLRRGCRVVALDLDLPSLEITRDLLEYKKKEFKSFFRENPKACSWLTCAGDSLNFPFADNTFDIIICSEVMEHVPDDSHAAQELYRVLKEDGCMAVTVPTFPSELLYDTLTWEYFSTPGGHVRRYLPLTLKRILSHTGFSIYSLDHRHALHTIWWAIRSVVGLHKDKHPLTKGYHTFLTMGLFSNTMRRVESTLNWFFPKSLILYCVKKASRK